MLRISPYQPLSHETFPPDHWRRLGEAENFLENLSRTLHAEGINIANPGPNVEPVVLDIDNENDVSVQGEQEIEEIMENDENDEIRADQILLPPDRFNILPFLDPDIPEGLDEERVVDNVEGWTEIDKWSAWNCASCMIQPLEDVPKAYQKAWSSAFSSILRKIKNASHEEELDRYLKWF